MTLNQHLCLPVAIHALSLSSLYCKTISFLDTLILQFTSSLATSLASNDAMKVCCPAGITVSSNLHNTLL